MKKLLLIVSLFLFINSSYSQMKKIAKKLDLFVAVENLNSVTVIDDSNSGMEATFNRYLLKSGYKTLSKRAAQQRIAQLELDKNKLNINGSTTIVKSDLVILISNVFTYGVNRIYNANFEIIDLSDNGRVVGGASYRQAVGGKTPSEMAEAFVYALDKNLK